MKSLPHSGRLFYLLPFDLSIHLLKNLIVVVLVTNVAYNYLGHAALTLSAYGGLEM
jgi:hypothetical protein